MANGSVESKGESNVWPADDTAQTQPSSQHHQDPSTPNDLNDNTHAAGRLPPLPHPRPPSPMSVAELQERAVQDSQNNNVDENSNDRHYDEYAAAAYPRWEASFPASYPRQEESHFAHSTRESLSPPSYLSQEASCPTNANRQAPAHLNREISSHHSREASDLYSSREARSLHPRREATQQLQPAQDVLSHHLSSHHTPDVPHLSHSQHPDQSVRPRVRQPPQHHRDEPDRAPLPQQRVPVRRDSEGSCSIWQNGGLRHRRNQSEGTKRYPPLPNLNHPFNDSGEASSQLPGYGTGSPYSSQRLLPLTLGGSECNPHLLTAGYTAEQVTQEAEELLTTFTSETLRNNRLEVPQWMQAVPSVPQMVRAGRELRVLADAFACTAERQKVRYMAESVNLDCIKMSDFFHLCAELFYNGITRERIVALFTFVGDVAVHQMMMKRQELIHRLMKWSLKYLVEHVCRWVQEAGGWVAVLTCGANFLYRCAVFVFCVCGSVAAGLFIYKTLKNG